jgi:peptidoglycan/xylan/chitin deacetylase (PgdA/CDA1 family)
MPVMSTARRRFAEAAKAALRAVPLPVWQRLFPRDAVLPMYHVVSDERLPHLGHYPYKNSSQFEADVVYAKEHHGFIQYDELLASRLHGRKVLGNRCLFSFDDGLAECFSVVRPILKRHAASAAFFITTDLLDNRCLFFESAVSLGIDRVGQLAGDEAARICSVLRLTDDDPRTRVEAAAMVLRRGQIGLRPAGTAERLLTLYLLGLDRQDERLIREACGLLNVDTDAYLQARKPYMTSEQVRQLAADGFTIGGHGLSHRRLQSLSDDEIEREIVASCDVVRQITGQKKVPFAFPYYGTGLDKRFLGDLRQRHPEVEVYFDTGDFARNVPFIIDRSWADLPGPSPTESNLHAIMLDCWAHPRAWRQGPLTLLPQASAGTARRERDLNQTSAAATPPASNEPAQSSPGP